MTGGRVLVSKLGLDGHDVGARVVARILRDGGFEVVYLGIRQTPEKVARVAIDEDVDLVGISLLSGAHLPLVGRLLAALAERRAAIPVVVGGVIPRADHALLVRAGVSAVVDPHASSVEIVETVGALVCARPGS